MARKYLLEIHPQTHEGWPDSLLPPFADWGEFETDADRLRKDPESIRVVFFAGGTDVSPSLYGEQRSSKTEEPDVDRDRIESELFQLAFKANLPMIGICRGSQFLCAMAGGKIGQHVEGHGLEREQTHPVRAIDVDGRTIEFASSSRHHQIQLPPSSAEVLAWAAPRLTDASYLDGNDQSVPLPQDYEAAFHPGIRAIGFQWHPEWMDIDHPCVAYTKRISIDRLKL